VVNADDVSGVTARWRETCGEQSTYSYDPMGNRTSLTTPAGTLTYTYDTADRVLNISDGTAFTWDANGNQLSKGNTDYAYDTANRLTQVDTDSATVQFTYDGDGKRTSKSVNGTASYTYDVNTALPVVLVESIAAGDTRYIHGLDLLARVEPDDTTNYYHYDGLGSTRQLTDEAGDVVAGYEYDAFGNLRMVAGSSANPFTFTGEQTDDESNLIYLRARYYDSQTGRFLSRDPFAGLARRSQSLNKYPYAQNNPVRYVDPNGEAILTTIVGAGLVGGAVVAYLSHPEPANAPGPNDPVYSSAPFRPVVHAAKAVALSKLFEPVTNFIGDSGHATSLKEGFLKWVSHQCGASCLFSGSLVGANLAVIEESTSKPVGDWLDRLLYPNYGKPFPQDPADPASFGELLEEAKRSRSGFAEPLEDSEGPRIGFGELLERWAGQRRRQNKEVREAGAGHNSGTLHRIVNQTD